MCGACLLLLSLWLAFWLLCCFVAGVGVVGNVVCVVDVVGGVAVVAIVVFGTSSARASSANSIKSWSLIRWRPQATRCDIGWTTTRCVCCDSLVDEAL